MPQKGLSQVQILVMAVTAGVCAANIYYCQPILNNIATSIDIDEKSAGLISVLGQVGYGLGLFFVTPLGDKMERKRLILILQVLLIAFLILMAFASNTFMLYAASLAIGITAVVGQVILPMAASLSPTNRGKVVGIIFTGLLVGVLLSRVFSGYIAAWFSWRHVYGGSAILVAMSAVLMQLDFPNNDERFQGTYAQLLKSTLSQFSRFGLLRRSALLGALAFGTLSAFWITLTFHLSGAPFHYKSETIGLFGFLAAGGALLVPLFGKFADKRNKPTESLAVTFVIILISILLLKFFPESLMALWAAVLLLDIGVQGTQVTNIALIYTLDSTANSRINTVYMTCYFLGGAVGAYAGILCWQWDGWAAVTSLMSAFAVIALLVIAIGIKRAKI